MSHPKPTSATPPVALQPEAVDAQSAASAAQVSPKVQESMAKSPAVPREKVLLVTRKQSLCRRLADLLAATGFDSNQTASTIQAAKLLKEPGHQQYSGIIVDQGAAGDDLVDFCIRTRAAAPGLAIVTCLTHRDDELEFSLLEHDVDDVFTEDHLASAAKRLTVRLNQRRQIGYVRRRRVRG